MADETTPYLGLVKPEVNGEQTENVWGFDLNANFDKIDAKLAALPTTDAPLDGDIYGRRQGAWSRTVMQTDFVTLSNIVQYEHDRNVAQDTDIAGKANTVHTHTAADITNFNEATDDRVAALLTAGPNITLQYDDALDKLQISSSGSGGGGAGPPPIGDYGDIVVTNLGATWTIDTAVVTFAKIQNVTADKLLGSIAAGSVQEIACTAAGRALIDDVDATAQRTTLGLGTAAMVNVGTLQPADPTLTALAGLSGNGLVEQTGVDVFGKRAIGAAAGTDIPDRAAADARYQAADPTLTSLSFLDATAGLLEETGQDVFVKRAIGVGAATSIPTRADGDARWALLDSPVFIGDARAVTPATADNDTSIATTAFVKAQAYAALASPVFTGDPRAPTPATADNDTSIATTAFIRAYLASVEPPSDGNEYVRVNGAWRLKEQTFDLNGLAEQNVVVPAGAKLVVMNGRFLMGDVNPNPLALRVSLDGSTFLVGATDYYGGFPEYLSGPGYQLATMGTTDFIFMSNNHSVTSASIQFDGQLIITAPVGSVCSYMGNSRSISSNGYTTSWPYGYVNMSASATSIKSLKVFAPDGSVGLVGSRLNVRWIY
jgi:hypothetical protein